MSVEAEQCAAALARNQLINDLLGKIIRKPTPRTVRNPLAGSEVSAYTESGRPRAAVDVLVDIGRRADLFHAPDGEPFARVLTDGGAVLYAINSSDFSDYLSGEHYAATGKGANRNAIGDARATLAAIAKFDGPTESVYLRVAGDAGRVLIDAGESRPACYECTADGWQRLEYHPVNFRRNSKAAALPVPTFGDFKRIAKYINAEPSDIVLIGAWLLAALRPGGPFPILVLTGEQGSAKSTAGRAAKMLVDPSEAPLRAPPRDERDLLIAALSSWVLALDNLSGITPEQSDAFCRIATGGALSARKLYTDAEETLINVQRPVVLNGIDDVVSRPDLAERSVHITLPRIAKRETEATLNAGFRKDAPRIFAALLDGVCLALRDAGKHPIPNKPRMADFVEWAAAGVPALGFTSEEFLTAYRRNSENAVELGLDTSPIARSLQSLVPAGSTWTGSASDLLVQLSSRAAGYERDGAQWPRSAKGLLTALRRLAPSLRHIGIDYAHSRTASARTVTLTRKPSVTEGATKQPDPSSLHRPRPGALHDSSTIFDE